MESKQRKLKFRAYDKFHEQYLKQDFVTDFPDTSSLTQEWTFQQLVEYDDYIVEEYTGIKDELHNEIWEGDIIYDPGRQEYFVVEMQYGEWRCAPIYLTEDWSPQELISYSLIEAVKRRKIHKVGGITIHDDLVKLIKEDKLK